MNKTTGTRPPRRRRATERQQLTARLTQLNRRPNIFPPMHSVSTSFHQVPLSLFHSFVWQLAILCRAGLTPFISFEFWRHRSAPFIGRSIIDPLIIHFFYPNWFGALDSFGKPNDWHAVRDDLRLPAGRNSSINDQQTNEVLQRPHTS